MSEQIKKTQKAILRELSKAGKLTSQQAETQPLSEGMKEVIPDILRVCKDDEAVASAVAKVAGKPQFNSAEDGVAVYQGSDHDDWIIYNRIIYMANLYDKAAQDKAFSYARSKKWEFNGIGIISNSRLEQVRSYDDGDIDATLDDETLKLRASARVDEMIREAAKLDASDIHLQPTQGDQIAVRYRIDGELITRKLYKNVIHDSICRVVIENLCNLSLEVSKPQDGKFEVAISSTKKINLRVSSIPVTRGSERTLKLVFRLLGNNASLANLDRLGLAPANKALLHKFGASPNGMIIVTGPTGSGKTTTLNAFLLDIASRNPNRNYHTIEDPVELQHEGMSHTECGAQVSFADALRSLLRQDPDVVLVGEMRDNETAELGYKAAMTGHLVLSTLHTNNAHESLGRLERMDIDRDIIVTNTTAFIAQRLVRSLCRNCKVAYELRTDARQLEVYGKHSVFKEKGPNAIIYRANPDGCNECKANESHHSGGLKGRRGVIEILEMTPSVQVAILEGETPSLLRRRQIREGAFYDLWDDGLRLVAEGSVGIEQLEYNLKSYLSDREVVSGTGKTAGETPAVLVLERAGVSTIQKPTPIRPPQPSSASNNDTVAHPHAPNLDNFNHL